MLIKDDIEAKTKRLRDQLAADNAALAAKGAGPAADHAGVAAEIRKIVTGGGSKPEVPGFAKVMENGTRTFIPSIGSVYSDFTVETAVPIPPEKKLQVIDLGTIRENGIQEVYPALGYDGMSQVSFEVQVPTGGGLQPPGFTRVETSVFEAPGGSNRVPLLDLTNCGLIAVYILDSVDSLLEGEFTGGMAHLYKNNSLFGGNFYQKAVGGATEDGLMTVNIWQQELVVTDFELNAKNMLQGRRYGVVQFYTGA